MTILEIICDPINETFSAVTELTESEINLIREALICLRDERIRQMNKKADIEKKLKSAYELQILHENFDVNFRTYTGFGSVK